tara:strand:+ start:77 stop:547 length:471 start_codon:yes stop_codon:yes gene_type:complete
MKKTILILFVIIASIGHAQGVHDKAFFKKTTNKRVNISEYLESEGFIEIEVNDQNKIDMLTKPHDGMLESLESSFKAYLSSNNEMVYVVSVKVCADETIDDQLGIGFRIYNNMPMRWGDHIARRNEISYIKTTEDGRKCAYLLVPYGMSHYLKNKI